MMKTLAGSRVDAAQVSLERKGKEEKEEEEHAAVGKKGQIIGFKRPVNRNGYYNYQGRRRRLSRKGVGGNWFLTPSQPSRL